MKVSYTFLGLSLLAEVLGTVGGFGSSVFFVPLANFYLDFHSVLALTAMLHLASNVSKIALFRKGIDKKLLLAMGVPSVVFVIAGGLLSRYFAEKWLSLSLGGFLAAFSALLLMLPRFSLRPSSANAFTGGAFSGFFAGLLGTGGAVRGLALAAFSLEKEVFVATSAMIDFFIDLTRSIVYYENGYFHTHDLIYLPFLFGIAFLGSYIGKRLLELIPQQAFRRISLFLILAIGVTTLVSALFKSP